MKTQKSKTLSASFIKKLAEISAGYLLPEKFEQIISLFEKAASSVYFSHQVESNLLRVILSMYDRISFLNDCLNYPHYPELLLSVCSNSNYLTDILVRNPEYFSWAGNPSVLAERLEPEDLTAEIQKMFSAYKTFKTKLNALRGVKRKEILRIGIKDLFENKPFDVIVDELSVLAKTISSELFSLCYAEVLSKNGIKEIDRQYALFALGKLGGNELNYSSDIDLMVFYDDEEELEAHGSGGAVKSVKSYQEILIETIYLFIDSASTISENGFIYRVDFRLRPDGRNSALTRAISYYLNYYETRGEDWEKQMLIKASFVCGSRSLYDKFIGNLTPFIYPSSFAISPTEQIKKLKAGIEKRIGSEDNIKLSAGGIRDIEFAIQALQLIFGGKYKSVRTPSTLTAINNLKNENLLSDEEASLLSEAYIFFRRIEHFLQLMNDKQTHTIPSEGEMLLRLCFYLGSANPQDFKKKLASYRNKVSAIYNSVMGTGVSTSKEPSFAINFSNKTRAEKDLSFLREGKGILGQRQFQKDTIEAFQDIENTLLKFLSGSTSPDQVLQNFARVIRAETFPSIWYKQFSNKKFFESFLNICEYSQMAIDLFAEDVNLHESFLTRKCFEKPNIKDGPTKFFLFRLLVQYTLKLIPVTEVSRQLSLYFKNKTEVLTHAEDINSKIKTEFFIAALGSFGSGDLSFASDLDIIFVADDLPSSIDVQKYFQALFLKLKEDFKPFEIDCRLRPEGKSSWLIWDLKNYEQYILNRARVWEIQSFCKISFICGNKTLYRKFLNIVKKRIMQEEKGKIKKEISEMRKKLLPQQSSLVKSTNIKKSRGGITDIEFVIQLLLMLNPPLYSSLAGSGTLKTLEKLTAAGNDYSSLTPMEDNFLFLKNLELTNQSMFNVLNTILPADEVKFKKLASYLGYVSAGELQNVVLKTMKSNQTIFDKYFGSKD